MTVKQLREALSKYPDNMNVFVAERKTEYAYGLLNSISTKEINFWEDPFETDESLENKPKEKVVVLDEE